MVLDQLTTGAHPTSEAIIQSLYEDAVRYSQAALISTLLDAGKDVNALLDLEIRLEQRICRERLDLYLNDGVHPMTPLQWAASVCDVKLATFLIGAGAKVDLGDPTPLAIVCSITKPNDADVLRFAHLLIYHGARVNASPDSPISILARAVTSENKHLVQLILQHGGLDIVKPRTRRWYPRITLKHKFSLNEGYEMTLPAEITGDDDDRDHDDIHDPVSALQSSIVVGNKSITDILLSSISNQENGNEIFEWALVTACAAGVADLVQRLLAHLETHFHDRISLINEMIMATTWDTDCRIARLLIDHRAVQRELQHSACSFFQAAALHGNVPLIKLLKSRGFDDNSGPKLQFKLSSGEDGRKCRPPPLASTPMGCAIWMNHQDAIETLLVSGANLAELHLVHAIRSGSEDLLFQVLSRCDDVDELWDGQRALEVAILHCRGITIIRKLIEAGAVPHGHDLVNAVRSDDQEVVHFLLPSCDVLATTKNGENVLEAACRTGNLEMAKFYFARGGGFSSRAILLAASKATKTHDYRMVKYLVTIRRSRPTDVYEATALALSIRMENIVLVKLLMSDCFEPNSAVSIYCRCDKLGSRWREGTELQDCVYPIAYDDQNIDIEDLFETGCFFGKKCHRRLSPMLVAALLGQETLGRTMLNRGYLPDAFLVNMCYQSSEICAKTRDAIMGAYASQIPLVADCGWHERLLMAVLKHNADIKIIQDHLTNLKSLDFWCAVYVAPEISDVEYSPLGWAALSGKHEIVELFLKAGANPNAQHAWNRNCALICATRSGNLEIASILLDHGSDINAHGSEAFLSALLKRDFRVMTFLLKNGVNVSMTGRTGLTPLEIASNHGMIDAIELIFTGNVDIHGRMRIHFIRAVASAIKRCRPGTAKILKQRGGWSEQDQEISKTLRATIDHSCPRFLYDDSSLQGCEWCLRIQASSCSQIVCEDDKSTTSIPTVGVAVTEGFEDHEESPLTSDLSMLDVECEVIGNGKDTETFSCPLIPYGLQDRELDDIVRGLLLEDCMIIDA
ncbi:hypothetical protein E8E14_001057 [Neopestalotiopsis sp. 37M]|nr:hypothetical protein E8E14_001057 [Neopestalotiopsis sp. 37M]